LLPEGGWRVAKIERAHCGDSHPRSFQLPQEGMASDLIREQPVDDLASIATVHDLIFPL
jgi:hypothetical protein